MTRRDAIGSLAALLLPTWKLRESVRPPVPLHEFCDPRGESFRFECHTPFLQSNQDERLFGYATDCKIAVRVDANDNLKGNDEGRRPPISKLDWGYDSLTNWKPWPKSNPILRDNGICTVCDGYGTLNKLPAPEHAACDGFGCKKCRYSGVEPATADCPACRGKCEGEFADLQPLHDGIVVAVKYDRKLRTHLRDVEYALRPTHLERRHGDVSQVVAFRFDGGLGLLMPMSV